MAGLIGFYIFIEKRQSNAFLAGLIFALLGDCFLLFSTVEFFVIGLICFLIMQVCYAVAFNTKRRWKDLGSIRTAVAFYAVAITIMAIYAYLRHPRLRGYKIVLLGVILFILSDALLAADKFNGTIPYGQIMVMVTYMLAQYFIVTGEVLSNMPRPKKISDLATNGSFNRHKRK